MAHASASPSQAAYTYTLAWLNMSCGHRKHVFLLCLHALMLLLLPNFAVSKAVIEYLPGYPGKLPFKLETGYVSVGDLEEVQLFYYFIESARNPVRDPLLLWLTGGPGCSALSGLVYEIGPLTFDYETFNGSLPSFVINPYAWTNIANIIFLDAPVGTGFSYSTTQEGYRSTDTLSSKSTYEFIRKWVTDHPQFSKNPLYIAGDSYSGVIVPMVTLHIANGNNAKLKPHLSLQGYMLGNPVTNVHDDENSRVQYYHRVGLIPNEIYNEAKTHCNGEYVTPDPDNVKCVNAIALIAVCTLQVCDAHILEPKCSFASPKPKGLQWGRRFFEDEPVDLILATRQEAEENWCRNSNYVLSYVWANDASVQEALHIRNGTIEDWNRCNKSLDYTTDILSTVDYHKVLIKDGYRALVYSGDHDMLIPYTGTVTWIHSLNFTIVDGWRPWFVEGQIAGFTVRYRKAIGDGLVFATVKGAGHTAPEYKPKQCLAMVDRWLSYYLI
ncbi:Peptidase_S10 domain-containing protein [Cephalotus follicularis]|uniref:Peptidase_S10 domain-containing protein n=1 Tax=Cephalotus follicularis TaxID=3775 RepID=A0A1Q3C669_CEPFO|nr:Peptidase_S10 domain-containing protein [Cephalotus follicularis]